MTAVDAAIEAIDKGSDRVLLVMATGTGKTYTAFQIIWRLWKAGRKKRIYGLSSSEKKSADHIGGLLPLRRRGVAVFRWAERNCSTTIENEVAKRLGEFEEVADISCDRLPRPNPVLHGH